jgi:hypothetical protein
MKLNIFCTGIFLKTEDCEESSSYMQVYKVFLSEDRLPGKEGMGANHTEKKSVVLAASPQKSAAAAVMALM